MAFSEEIINKVKEMADFKCCRCKHISFEVHHIIPQKDGGPDTLENAAPLCPNCHSDFGDNKMKRKEITQMRNLWYKRVKEMYKSQAPDFGVLNNINLKLDALSTNQDKALVNLKETLMKVASETIGRMTVGTAQVTASGIANASISPSYQNTKGAISEVYDSPNYYNGIFNKRVKCPKCGTLGHFATLTLALTSSALLPKHYKCETCGTEFE